MITKADVLTNTWPIYRSCLRWRTSSNDHDGVQTHTNRQQREVLVDNTHEENVNEGKQITNFQKLVHCLQKILLIGVYFLWHVIITKLDGNHM